VADPAGLVVRTTDGGTRLHPDATVLDIADSGLLQIFAPSEVWVATYAPGTWVSVVAQDAPAEEATANPGEKRSVRRG
jgi:hypothetical protein